MLPSVLADGAGPCDDGGLGVSVACGTIALAGRVACAADGVSCVCATRDGVVVSTALCGVVGLWALVVLGCCGDGVRVGGFGIGTLGARGWRWRGCVSAAAGATLPGIVGAPVPVRFGLEAAVAGPGCRSRVVPVSAGEDAVGVAHQGVEVGQYCVAWGNYGLEHCPLVAGALVGLLACFGLLGPMGVRGRCPALSLCG